MTREKFGEICAILLIIIAFGISLAGTIALYTINIWAGLFITFIWILCIGSIWGSS